MPGRPVPIQPKRVITYIDGFNLYFGLRTEGWERFLWLNSPLLASSLIKDTQELVLTKYFTSRITDPPDKMKRQSDYLEALQVQCQESLKMYFGRYQDERRTCRMCGKVEQVSHEKKTDVNIAVEMITDAHADAFDTAMLISADSDLVPAVAAVRKLFPEKRVIIAFPPARFSVELKEHAHSSFSLGRAKFSAAQLPDHVIKADGTVLKRPEKWSSAATAFGAVLSAALQDPDLKE